MISHLTRAGPSCMCIYLFNMLVVSIQCYVLHPVSLFLIYHFTPITSTPSWSSPLYASNIRYYKYIRLRHMLLSLVFSFPSYSLTHFHHITKHPKTEGMTKPRFVSTWGDSNHPMAEHMQTVARRRLLL